MPTAKVTDLFETSDQMILPNLHNLLNSNIINHQLVVIILFFFFTNYNLLMHLLSYLDANHYWQVEPLLLICNITRHIPYNTKNTYCLPKRRKPNTGLYTEDNAAEIGYELAIHLPCRTTVIGEWTSCTEIKLKDSPWQGAITSTTKNDDQLCHFQLLPGNQLQRYTKMHRIYSYSMY